MQHLHQSGILASVLLAGVLLAAGTASAADLLVDDFTDGDASTLNSWGTWMGDTSTPVPGAGLGVRTRQVFPIGFANKDAQFTTLSGNGVYQYGLDPQTALFTLQAASDRTADAEKYQSVGLQAVRGSSYDASGHQYVRFTAWLADPQPAYAILTDAQLLVSFTDSLNRMSIGPWDATGTSIAGLPLNTVPTAHLVPIAEAVPTVTKVDPVFTAIFGTTSVDWADVRSIGVQLRRAGAVAGSSSFGGIFYLDDVMFLDAEPEFIITAPVFGSVDESAPSNSTTFMVKLSALPSGPVTVSLTPSDDAQISISPASWTFIPSGTPGAGESLYSDDASFTITAVDDAIDEPDTLYSVSIAPSGSDLLYNSMTIGDISVTVIDDDAAGVSDWRMLE